jgi:hypothetical protein
LATKIGYVSKAKSLAEALTSYLKQLRISQKARSYHVHCTNASVAGPCTPTRKPPHCPVLRLVHVCNLCFGSGLVSEVRPVALTQRVLSDAGVSTIDHRGNLSFSSGARGNSSEMGAVFALCLHRCIAFWSKYHACCLQRTLSIAPISIPRSFASFDTEFSQQQIR